MVIKKTLTISDELNQRLLEYEQAKPYAQIKLSRILSDQLNEILKEEGY